MAGMVNLVESSEYPNIGFHPWEGADGLGLVANYVWDVDTLSWIKQTAVNGNNPATEVTVLNFPTSFDATQSTHDNLNANANIQVGNADVGAGNPVPISAASLPLPSGAATSANQATEITSLQLIDDIVHATNGALSKSAAIGGQLDDTSTTAATEDNVAPVRITAQRAFHANLRNVSGTEIGTASNPVRTDPTGTTAQPTADNQTIADNAGFTDGTSKVFMGGHVFDETAGTALTENDAAASRIDSKRAQVLVLEDETTRGRRTTVTAANALKVDNSAVTQPVKDAQSSFDHGRKSSIGTSAVQITSSSITANLGVVVKAARTNAVRIFVGNSDVTADSTDATDGMELGPGESVLVKVDNANKVYVIAESGSSAKAFWLVA